jgi:hypothetical protein
LRGIKRAPRRATLELLPGGVFASQAGTGSLAGRYGEALTFTRATTKVVSTGTGTVATVASGAPGVEPAGLLVESAHTNICLQSQAIQTSPWSNNGGGQTTTGNAAAAPDGTTTATQLDITLVGQGGWCGRAQQVSLSAGTYTLSLYVRGVSGSGTVYASLLDSAGTWFSVPCTYTTSWQRFSVTFTAAAGTAFVVLGVDTRDSAQQPQGAQSVYLWQCDLVAAAYPQSPVKTTSASATCNADAASLPGTTLPVSAGNLECVVTPRWSSSTAPSIAYILDTRAGTTGTPGILLRVGSGSAITLITANASAFSSLASSALTWNAGQAYRIRTVWGAGNLYVYRDNVLVGSSTAGTAAMPDAHGALNLGADKFSASQFDGNISDLRFYA